MLFWWSSLIYNCTCSNNSSTALLGYQGTLPNLICEAINQQHQSANLGDVDCIPCGTLMPIDFQAVAASRVVTQTRERTRTFGAVLSAHHAD